jgi:hypothetical protein
MENKNFIINESERERILQKHQDATKNLYLNIISEQSWVVDRLKNQVTGSTEMQTPKEPEYISRNNQKLESDTTSIAPIILFKGTKFFWNDKGGYSFRDSGENPGLTQVNYGKWRWFSCKTKKFNFGNKGIYVNSQLSNALFTSNDLCRNFLNPKGTKPKTTGLSGTSKQGLVKPSDEVITKLINMVK